MAKKQIKIDMSVNDHKGDFTGFVGCVDIPNLVRFTSIDLCNFKPLRYLYDRGKRYLLLDGQRIEFLGYQEYVGSINFNTYFFSPKEAVKLINYLFKSELWVLEEVNTELHEHIRITPLIPSDIEYFTTQMY